MARRGKKRQLAPEDLHLWQRVTEGVDPLRPCPPAPCPAAPPAAPPAPAPRPRIDRPQTALGTFRIGQAAPGPVAPPGPAAAVCAPRVMDKRTHGRMTRGKLHPEARLDLHGHTLDAAHAELNGFILSAQARGLRLVLVITGKGRGADGAGALRRAVPLWLSQAPLAPVVLQLREAHRSHGGGGALYVYLRRKR